MRVIACRPWCSRTGWDSRNADPDTLGSMTTAAPLSRPILAGVVTALVGFTTVSYTHLTLPTKA